MRGSGVQIPPPAPNIRLYQALKDFIFLSACVKKVINHDKLTNMSVEAFFHMKNCSCFVRIATLFLTGLMIHLHV